MRITGRTDLYGVVGYPVQHSLSPVFQNAAFSHLGIDAVYLPFEVKPEDLEVALRGLQLSGVRGLNVTVPHKETALKLADWASPDAREIGSANTLRFTDRGIEAYNTDWMGFLRSLEEILDPAGRRVLVLGAGGASRAVVYALRKVSAEVFLWNRTRERAEALAERFGVQVVDSPEEVLDHVDVVVNTTSVGLREDDPPPLSTEALRGEHVVVDLIYRETALIRAAREKGCRAQTGFPMLLYQGAESFRIWTGCEPPLQVMKLSLLEFGYPTGCSRTP